MSTQELEPAHAYDLWAPQYESDANPMVALTEALLAECEEVPLSVVELGCGTGRNLALLQKKGATEVAGVDLSEGMLKVAQARLPDAPLWCQDIRSPAPLPAKSADWVLVSLVLEHIENPEPVFHEAARLLRDGGMLWIMELHPTALDGGSRAHFEGPGGERFTTAAWRHDQASLAACARAAGLAAPRGKEALADVYPNTALRQRFPSRRRGEGVPWLLQGKWYRPPQPR